MALTAPPLVDIEIADLIRRALDEDVATGDITAEAVIPEGRRALARIKAKSPGILAGILVAEAVFLAVDPEVDFEAGCTDGAHLAPGDRVAVIGGSARAMLTAERTALNFVQHLSGIATATAEAVRLVRGTGVRLLDTRKTIPGMRRLEKYAVSVGGGYNHRAGLWDHYLVKENHVDLAGGIAEAVLAVRRHGRANPERGLEVEVRNLQELAAAVAAGVDRVMLDNFSPSAAADAVATVSGRCEVEISGGVTMDNLRAYAAAHPDFISLGFLTHSAKALDISMTLVV